MIVHARGHSHGAGYLPNNDGRQLIVPSVYDPQTNRDYHGTIGFVLFNGHWEFYYYYSPHKFPLLSSEWRRIPPGPRLKSAARILWPEMKAYLKRIQEKQHGTTD